MLEEIGLPFQLAHVSTADGATHTAKHFKLNPKGRVPVLVAGDSVLTEAPAIPVHLAMQHPDKKLLSSTPDTPMRSMEWCNWLSGTVHAVAVRQVWRPELFTDMPAQHEAIATKGKKNLADAFSHIGARLASAAWAQHAPHVIERPATVRALATENISVWQ